MHSYHEGRGGPGGWWVLSEPELQAGTEVVRAESFIEVELDLRSLWAGSTEG